MNTINKQGFTLLEMMIVIAIIGILAGVSLSSFYLSGGNSNTNGENSRGGFRSARSTICKFNCVTMERAYLMEILVMGLEESNQTFIQFLNNYGKDICPQGGVITRTDGKIRCSIHSNANPSADDGSSENSDDGENGAVPFL